MKNIHVLPTDNSSKLSYNKDGVLELHRLQWRKNTQNINITSDEEIKNGYAFHLKTQEVLKVKGVGEKSKEIFHSKGFSYSKDCRKIILTTDQNLIKDGVQAIDDEFLEWFVKNPSCYIATLKKEQDYTVPYPKMRFVKPYKIIIPKEEPKQHSKYLSCCRSKEECHCKEEPKQDMSARLQNCLKKFNLSIEEALELEDWKLENIGFSNKTIIELRNLKLKQLTTEEITELVFSKKQETLEEVAERETTFPKMCYPNTASERIAKNAFINGAKWQQEQILDFLYEEITERRDYSAPKMCEKVIEFIEKFKKK